MALQPDWRFDGEAIEPGLIAEQRLHLAKGDISTDGVAKLREVLGAKTNLTIHECSPDGIVGLVAAGLGTGLLTSVPAAAAAMNIRIVPVRPTVSVVAITAIWLADSVPANMNAFLNQFEFPGAPGPVSSSSKRAPGLPN